MMTEHWACMRLPWSFVLAFWCEKNESARKFIFDNLGSDTSIPNWTDVTNPCFLREAHPRAILWWLAFRASRSQERDSVKVCMTGKAGA